MRLIDADHLDKRIYEEIPLKEFGTIKRMARMREIIEEEPTVGGWVSVTERLPEEKGEYIAFDGETVFGAYYEINAFGTRWTDATEGYWEYKVTHWMPMPEPPEGVSGDA